MADSVLNQTGGSDVAAADATARKTRKPRAPAKGRRKTDVIQVGDNSRQQMGFWPDAVRGVPNVALRGALFSISRERETWKKRKELASVDGYQIIFKGERLNQRDLDLWEMLLHISRQQPYGKHIEFVASDLLKALGRTTSGDEYGDLKEDIARLRACSVEILVSGENTFGGGLIQNFYREEASQRYVIVFDEAIKRLFDTGITHVDWDHRMKLKDNSLAKWLHGFYSTHASPLKYKVETIKELCGSTTGRLADFRAALRKALDKLKSIGAITYWDINPKTDLVTVRRKPSPSQKRHLENKQAAVANAEFSSSDTGTLPGFDAL
ncbi:plasmid replication initiator TrfA [Massilia oculi]|uniref:plasmid replication initiator TrfA n=1 Tax=Massilia oculi TaxID=945844 RepID=UPI001AAEBD32|nr:plasmid replication initiator TrfA [Massilia oculi]